MRDSIGIFSCDADDHVDQFCGAEGLADERADADELSVVFGIFYGDGVGEGHEDYCKREIGIRVRPTRRNAFVMTSIDIGKQVSRGLGFWRQAVADFIA